jgi:hypothetical protein
LLRGERNPFQRSSPFQRGLEVHELPVQPGGHGLIVFSLPRKKVLQKGPWGMKAGGSVGKSNFNLVHDFSNARAGLKIRKRHHLGDA